MRFRQYSLWIISACDTQIFPLCIRESQLKRCFLGFMQYMCASIDAFIKSLFGNFVCKKPRPIKLSFLYLKRLSKWTRWSFSKRKFSLYQSSQLCHFTVLNWSKIAQCIFVGLSCAVYREWGSKNPAPRDKPHDRPTDLFFQADHAFSTPGLDENRVIGTQHMDMLWGALYKIVYMHLKHLLSGTGAP